MPVESFREALRTIGARPLLWVPGIVTGACAAALWLMLNFTGAFFTSRLFILAGLVLMFFVVGMLVLLREKTGDFHTLVEGGMRYYFRVLIPQLVIVFMIVVLFVLLVVTFGFVGTAADPAFVGLLTFCIMVPTLMLTFFFDIAAVFEDKKVFESIQRSALLVSENMTKVIGYYLVCAAAMSVIVFGLMFAWEIALFERLAPLAEYNQTQIQAFTYEQLLAIIGPEGIWVTAAILFIGGLLIVPLMYSYKACFFKRLAGSTPIITQIGGEYDSKGRWYKY